MEWKCSMKYVQYIRGNYVVRIVVPDELRPIVGLKELVVNLGPDKKGSEKQAHGVIAGFLEHKACIATRHW